MKKIISFILIFAAIFSLIVVNASAAGEEFISDVALVYKDTVEEARAAIAGTDWKLLEHDLNANADLWFDDGVYLVYKTTTNVEEAITDLRVMDMYGSYSTANYEQRLEESRKACEKLVSYIRIAAAEFKTLYEAGDEMAVLAHRQMNYYKDIGETDLLMGDFLLNIPSDEALLTVIMQGNGFSSTNLISLLAVGVSNAGGKTLSEKISEAYKIKDTLTDVDYYDKANRYYSDFSELVTSVRRYEELAKDYNIEDEEMDYEEMAFVMNYASVAKMLEKISYGDKNLKDFLIQTSWDIRNFYPIVAALSEGQTALAELGAMTSLLQYSQSSKPMEELYALLEETEAELTDENGNFKPVDMYLGVDRSIFEGDFAFTDSAMRQEALSGIEWTPGYLMENTEAYPETLVNTLLGTGLTLSLGYGTVAKIAVKVAASALRAANKVAGEAARAAAIKAFNGSIKYKLAGFFTGDANLHIATYKVFVSIGVALVITAIGIFTISTLYNYYNPDYTPIPNTMIDIVSTDLGDKYVRYDAAKVFGAEEDKNADFNAYQGKEWNALYYTKDASAGNCLKPNFVVSESDSSVARRHQGISMFGEDKAFDLNSHVFDGEAPNVYVTVRYSTAKKAAADMPAVVGSMVATGALYALAVLGGAGLGVGGTILVQKAKKKKESGIEDSADPNPSES